MALMPGVEPMGERYPPLTPVAEYPLHSWNYDGREYACQRPEDPECLVFDWRCPSCLLAAQARIENFGDIEVAWRLNGEVPEQPVMLAWLIDRSVWWLYEQCDGVGANG
jgi:hypothetical protein